MSWNLRAVSKPEIKRERNIRRAKRIKSKKLYDKICKEELNYRPSRNQVLEMKRQFRNIKKLWGQQIEKE